MIKKNLDCYLLGVFASDIIRKKEIIHPDMQLSNIGYSEHGLCFTDFADIKIINIPEDLNQNTIRQLSSAILSIFNEFDNAKAKSYIRAGFIANGGILSDIIMQNCRNNGFSSFTYTEQKPSVNIPFNAESHTRNPINIQRISEWKNYSLDRIRRYEMIEKYKNSSERKRISSYNQYYLDRLFYMHNYLNILESDIPLLLVNAGLSAFKYEHNYRAYGLLTKAMPLLCGKWQPLKKITTEILIQLKLMCRLDNEFIKSIKENLDKDFVELTWILDDLDALNDTI